VETDRTQITRRPSSAGWSARRPCLALFPDGATTAFAAG